MNNLFEIYNTTKVIWRLLEQSSTFTFYKTAFEMNGF